MTPYFVIIDANYYGYRFHYSRGSIVGSAGKPIGVSYAFAEWFAQMRRDPRISHWALVADHQAPSFRHALYPEYKSHRDPMPADLRTQLSDLPRLAAASGIPCIIREHFEADDVIATLATRASAAGMQVRICTSDKDIDQIVDGNIATWDPFKDRIRGIREVVRERGVQPEQIVDYLCMIGDSADNVPGIRGIGSKGAGTLLREHGSLEQVIAQREQFTPKRKANIEAFIPLWDLTRQLITLAEVPDLPALETFIKPTEAPADARDGYAELGVPHARILGPPPQADTETDAKDRRCEWDEVCSAIVDHSVAIASVASGPHHGLAFCWGADSGREASFVPFEPERMSEILEASIALAREIVVLDVGGFHQHCLDHGVIPPASFCIRRAHALLTGDSRRPALADLTRRYLNCTPGNPSGGLPPPISAACRRARCTWRLAEALRERLERSEMLNGFMAHDMPTEAILAEIDQHGISVSDAELKRQRDHWQSYRNQLLLDLRQLAGRSFDPDRDQDVRSAVFERFELPVTRRSHGEPVIDDGALTALRDRHPFVQLLLQYRRLSRLLERTAVQLAEHRDHETGRVRCRHHRAPTGRIHNRLLGGLPLTTEPGADLGRALVARPDHHFIAAEFSQLELHVAAHLSGDEALLATLGPERDGHREAAAMLHGCELAAVTSSMRQTAKITALTAIHGFGPLTLAQRLAIPVSGAEALLTDYFARFTALHAYIASIANDVGGKGFCETIAGRRRPVPHITSANESERLQGIRSALQFIVQGSAADITRNALLRCRDLLPAGANIIAISTDRLVTECSTDAFSATRHAIEQATQAAWSPRHSLAVHIGHGDNWAAITT